MRPRAALALLATVVEAWFNIEQTQASSFLRERRANGALEEYLHDANFERECIEEICDQKELTEAYMVGFPSEDVRKAYKKYQRCLQSYHQLGAAKKQKLIECMADPDDCVGGMGPCKPDNTKQCIDMVGKADCKCYTGYGGEFCNILIDLCLLEPCGENGGCKAGYRSYTCNCYENWEGTNCTNEILDCRRVGDSQFSCGNYGTCTNDDQGAHCECDAGWIGDKCHEDEDECESGSHQCDPEYGICKNKYGTYDCNCITGFILDTQLDDNTCMDLDECADANGNCPLAPRGGCTNTIGSYNCYCTEGYELDFMFQSNCNNIDECLTDNGGCSQECADTDGSYHCSCNKGYYLAEDEKTCIDIDECDCLNLEQDILYAIRLQNYKFTCTANAGCGQICNNNNGSYSCACEAGYSLLRDEHSCYDVNECSSRELNNCEMSCTNTEGSFICACDAGYELDENGFGCNDVDECVLNLDNCNSPAFCVNDPGTFHCECPPGWLKLGSRTCHDIDECKQSKPCVHGLCINNQGSYTCDCHDTGYTGKHCDEDLDECACKEADGEYSLRHSECTHESVKMCAQFCTNEVGSYTCSCAEGYYLNDGGFECDDLDECKCINDPNYKTTKSECENVAVCEHSCKNYIGAYECLCDNGYYLKNKQNCVQVDECRCQSDSSYLHEVQKTSEACSEVTRSEKGCEQHCSDMVPGYECYCDVGFNLSYDSHHCDDIDECKTSTHECEKNQDCINTLGSYKCICKTGYIFSDEKQRCIVNKECPRTNKCSHGCTLEQGVERCYCEDGFELDAGKTTCRDTDECENGKNNCSLRQECSNTLGSYICKDENLPDHCAPGPDVDRGIFHTGSSYSNQAFGSHIRNSKFKSSQEFDISFAFKTYDSDGQLLYWSSKSKRKPSPKNARSRRATRESKARKDKRKSRNKSADERILISMDGDTNRIGFEVLTSKDYLSKSIKNTFSNGFFHTVRITTEIIPANKTTRITIQVNREEILTGFISSTPNFKTMYFGGGVIPPTRENSNQLYPTSSFDACFDFTRDSTFTKIEPDSNNDNAYCFREMQQGMYVNGGSGTLDISHLLTDPFIKVYQMTTIIFAFKPESTQGDIIKVGNVKLSLKQAKLRVEINDKAGSRDIPLRYWRANQCGDLHHVRIKTCLFEACSRYKNTQVIIDGQVIGDESWLITDEPRGYIPSSNVNEIIVGGDSFRGSIYPSRIPPRPEDTPIQAVSIIKQLPINKFVTYKDIYVNSAPYLSSR